MIPFSLQEKHLSFPKDNLQSPNRRGTWSHWFQIEFPRGWNSISWNISWLQEEEMECKSRVGKPFPWSNAQCSLEQPLEWVASTQGSASRECLCKARSTMLSMELLLFFISQRTTHARGCFCTTDMQMQNWMPESYLKLSYTPTLFSPLSRMVICKEKVKYKGYMIRKWIVNLKDI